MLSEKIRMINFNSPFKSAFTKKKSCNALIIGPKEISKASFHCTYQETQ